MPETTITINCEQRDGLYELIRNHLGSVGDLWHALEEDKDFAKAKQLGREFGEDLRLLTDLGWAEREQREYFRLTIPPLELIRALRRLQSEAGTILLGSDKSEEDVETVTTFRRGWKACEAVLDQIDRTRPPAIKLSRDFRDNLYRLLCRREILYRESPSGLAAPAPPCADPLAVSAFSRRVERRTDLRHPLRRELALSVGQLAQRHHQQVVEIHCAWLPHAVALVDLDLGRDVADRAGYHRDQDLAQRADRAVACQHQVGTPFALGLVTPPNLTAPGFHGGSRSSYQGPCPAARSSSSRRPRTARREVLWTFSRSDQPSGSNWGVRSYDSTTWRSISRSRSNRAYSAFSEGSESWSTRRSNFSRVVMVPIVPLTPEPNGGLAAVAPGMPGYSARTLPLPAIRSSPRTRRRARSAC